MNLTRLPNKKHFLEQREQTASWSSKGCCLCHNYTSVKIAVKLVTFMNVSLICKRPGTIINM